MTRAECGGTFRDGPEKRYGRCARCGEIDYEKYEGDRHAGPPRPPAPVRDHIHWIVFPERSNLMVVRATISEARAIREAFPDDVGLGISIVMEDHGRATASGVPSFLVPFLRMWNEGAAPDMPFADYVRAAVREVVP